VLEERRKEADPGWIKPKNKAIPHHYFDHANAVLLEDGVPRRGLFHLSQALRRVTE
jgi:hypothetical protein